MATNSNLKGIESGRANFAYNCVKEDVLNAVEKDYLKTIWDNEARNVIEKYFKDEKISFNKEEQQARKELIDFIVERRDGYFEDTLNSQFSTLSQIQQIDFKKLKDKLEAVNEEIKRAAGDYKSYIRKVPMYIKINGLAATFAFAKSKNKVAWDIIYYQTQEWLRKTGKIEKDDLMEGILALNSQEYRIATKETLALFNWLRRFAEGLIEGEEN